ncbi:nuclear body protein SP140-like protein [Chelmon rostratus]|uniref:nuclear body protein SP140-like protein n=1 Tax=Chelmon rostratus TaxID=109905 RepID=UPI001BE87A69|nr:nuclear body protein SP140-like protein [Chelmon rostratus]
MDPVDFLEDNELQRFFHCHKTEMSCMENPHTFISQLRDHNLIPEDSYKKMRRMKSKDNIKKALYEVLDWLESERSQHIKSFWSCVFKETILNHYPTLRLLRNRLMDGSFHFDIQLPERVEKEKEKADEGKRKELSEEEEEGEKKANSTTKKRKKKSKHTCDEEEEQAGPSSPLTPGRRKKPRKISFSSPLKKGEKSDIWTWGIYKFQLPVICGQQKGILNRDRLAKGEKCIVVDKQWFTPNEFERFAGKESFKNWKLSIRCMDTPLGKLVQEGHLKSVRYKGGCKKAKKSLFPLNNSVTVSDAEEDEDENEECDLNKVSSSSRESSSDGADEEGEEEAEQQPEASRDGSKVFEVTCGALTGTLHKKRFASGTRGRSIRTERSWMTPVEFMMEALCRSDASWRKDIEWRGEPLSVLTEENVLTIHSLLCACTLCKPNSEELENQKNDDECSICKREGQRANELVMCDHCPRSFHQKCHLPHIEDTILGNSIQWMCTFCVFRSNQGCYYQDELKRDAAMSAQISQHMLGCQYLLLRLCSADEEQTFAADPNLYLEDYSTVIQRPMWLHNVADKLQRQLYQTVGEFASDIQLIFTNCASYNRERHEILAKGNRLKELFDREFKNVLNISE